MLLSALTDLYTFPQQLKTGSLHTSNKKIPINPKKVRFFPEDQKEFAPSQTHRNFFRSNRKQFLNSILFSSPNTSLYFQDQTGTSSFPLRIHLPRGPETHCLIPQPQHTCDPCIAMPSYQELSNLLLDLSSSKSLDSNKIHFFSDLHMSLCLKTELVECY